MALIDTRTRGEARGLIVYACNARALAEGVREGEALADVRARVPGLVTRSADPAGDHAALAALALWCGRYGPNVATDGARGLWIDTSGVAHLFGSELALLVDLSHRLAAFGLTGRLGLADTLAAAHALAHFAPHGRLTARVATTDTVRTVLAPLPVEALRLEPETLLLLRRLGLKRIGQLYDLPRAALKRRFPSRLAVQAVLLRLDQALGFASEPLVPLYPPQQHTIRRAFGEPLIANEGLHAALAEAIAELCAGLAARHSGMRRLVVTLYRADGTCRQESVGFSTPTCRAPHIQRLLLERLERLADGTDGTDASSERPEAALLGFGIDALVLVAEHVEELGPLQAGMLTGGQASAAATAALIDRLANRLGPQRVQVLVPVASHIPERAQIRTPALDMVRPPKRPGRAEGNVPAWAALVARLATGPPRPCLLLARPEPIEVTAEIPEGPPARFTWRRVRRCVVAAQGPERIAPEWWRQLAPSHAATGGAASRTRTRDYYCVEDESGARYWLFRDGLYQDRGEDTATAGEAAATISGEPGLPRWFLHGLYA